MTPPRLEGEPRLVILQDLDECDRPAVANAPEPEAEAPPASAAADAGPSWPRVADDPMRQGAYEFRRQQGAEHDQALGALMPRCRSEFHIFMVELETEDPTFFSHLCVFASRTGRQLGWWVDVDGVVSIADFPWYVAKRLSGMSHNMAKMLVTGLTPWIMTDDVFLAGLANQFATNTITGAMGDYYKSIAEGEGVSTTGAVYFPGLASYPGDPTAWIRGRGDIARVAEAKNLTIQGGMLDRQARRDEAPPADVDVADDLVEARVLEMVAQNPDLGQTHTDKEGLYDQAKQSLLPAA